jgi:hypothetical protein
MYPATLSDTKSLLLPQHTGGVLQSLMVRKPKR